jgi:hypothetical protein
VVSVHTELTFGHLRYCFGDVPPQSNSAPGNVFDMECIEALNVIRTLSSVHHIEDKPQTARIPRRTHTSELARQAQNTTIIVHDDYLYVEQEYVHTIEANTCVLTLKIAYLFHLIE